MAKRISREKEKGIIEWYYKNERVKDILNNFNISDKSFRNVLERNNVKIDKNRYEDKYNFLLKSDDELLAYFLGLFMADGWLDNRGGFYISLIDKDLIEELANRIKYKNKVVEIKNKKTTSYRIGYGRKNLTETLKSFGFQVEKTGNEFVPKYINKNNFPHFLRGLSDGDGSFNITISKRHNSNYLNWEITCASRDFLQKILDYLRDNSIISYNRVNIRRRHSKKKKVYKFCLSTLDSTLFGEYIYENSTISLERKYETFLDAKNINIRSFHTKKDIVDIANGKKPEKITHYTFYSIKNKIKNNYYDFL